MLNKNQILPCWCSCNGPLLFLHQFLRFVLLLLLYHSGKLAIPHDHLFLLLQIMHLVIFKLLQRQGELSIFENIRVVFLWSRDGSYRLTFLRRADLPFVRNIFVAIHFRPISDHQFRKVVLLVLQQCGKDCVVIGYIGQHLSKYWAIPFAL